MSDFAQMRCTQCSRLTTDLDARLRKHNTELCGHCGGTLVYACDQCTQPATHAVVDSIHWPDIRAGVVKAEPYGPPRIRCDVHRTQAVQYHFE
jgi:predicted amidophosphoribosyltransferase